MSYTAVIDQRLTSSGPHVTNLPSCVATGYVTGEASILIREAIELYSATMD